MCSRVSATRGPFQWVSARLGGSEAGRPHSDETGPCDAVKSGQIIFDDTVKICIKFVVMSLTWLCELFILENCESRR